MDISWPPVYRIKKHRLAKHVKLKAVDNQCLEIVTPVRFNLKKIPAILEENKIWILQHLAKTRSKKKDIFPDQIILHALNQSWKIRYVECQAKFEMLIKPNQEIVFVGPVQSYQIYQRILIAWIKRVAQNHLLQVLEHLSQQTQLDFASLTIRDQKTLWGSCTVNKSINLNYKLIFLPPRLLQHVVIHELCHTLYLNHSPDFWKKVGEFDSDWCIHKRELREANLYLPEWI